MVNNAGIQREFRVKSPSLADDFLNENEIETNFTAPIHLTFLLLPHLLQQKNAAVVNGSSGLGFIPIAVMPVYCATKAALQSFSTSLRYQLKGISPEQVAKEALQGIKIDNYEIAIGLARVSRTVSKTFPKRMFEMINKYASGE